MMEFEDSDQQLSDDQYESESNVSDEDDSDFKEESEEQGNSSSEFESGNVSYAFLTVFNIFYIQTLMPPAKHRIILSNHQHGLCPLHRIITDERKILIFPTQVFFNNTL